MAYDVARYLAISSCTSPQFTPGGTLLYLSDASGTPQVWRTDSAGSSSERLTPYEERVSFVVASPTSEEFIFGMDRGSDERDQLYRYDLRTGAETLLTDDPSAKHAWGAWHERGDRIAFTSNRRDPGVFDVFTKDVRDPDATPELVFEGEGGWLTVETWVDDGVLALTKPRSSYHVDLFSLDISTGERVKLSGEKARFSHVTSHDGQLYFLTDEGAETTYVGRIDLDETDLSIDDGTVTTTVERVTAENDWNVDGFAIHEFGHIAYTSNVDGYSELRTGTLSPDGSTIVETAAPSVDGVLTGLTFDGDGTRIAYTCSENTRPFGVNVVQFGTVDETRWTPTGTCGIAPSTFRAAKTIRFETFDGREIPAYWTLPEGAEVGETPAIVDIHGGPEHQRRPWFYPTKQYYLNQGYAVLEPNVRGSSGYHKSYTRLDDVEKRMDSVQDLKFAVEWLREQDVVDPDRIVAYGRSYGGFMVLAAITEYPELWAAAVDFVGIANFVTFLENTGEWRRSHREAEYGSLTEDRELLEAISPLHRIDRVACPLFVQHGANDPRVPVDEARQVAEAAEKQGVPVELLVFDDEGHHTTSRDNRIEQFEAIADFLDEHL